MLISDSESTTHTTTMILYNIKSYEEYDKIWSYEYIDYYTGL